MLIKVYTYYIQLVLLPFLCCDFPEITRINTFHLYGIYMYIYTRYFDTLDERKRRVDKSHITHLSVRYQDFESARSGIY